MGLFDVNMPILYGEGKVKAFHRLQLEIIQKIPDQSLFAWRRAPSQDGITDSGLLADSPKDFIDSLHILCFLAPPIQSYSMTNMGLKIGLQLLPREGANNGHVFAALNCWKCAERSCIYDIAIELRQIRGIDSKHSDSVVYRRARCDVLEFTKIEDEDTSRPSDPAKITKIHVLEDAQMDHIEEMVYGTKEAKRYIYVPLPEPSTAFLRIRNFA